MSPETAGRAWLAETFEVDFSAVFAATPSPFLLLDLDFTILAANDAYCAATGSERTQLLGRGLFDAFPDNPDDPAADGVRNLRASLDEARLSGRPHTMAVQKYDVVDESGAFAQRYWSPMNVPVAGADGEITYLLHRVIDVTDFYGRSPSPNTEGKPVGDLRQRLEVAEADLYVRAQELRTGWQQEAAALRRLGALGSVALQLSRTVSVGGLVRAVVDGGVGALGADEGSVVLLPREQQGAGAPELPLLARACMAGGAPLLLPDAASGRAWTKAHAGPAEAEAEAELSAGTGCQAWAALPLSTEGKVVGALLLGWRQQQVFADAEVEVLTAFASQVAHALERIAARDLEREAAWATRRMSETLQRSMLTRPPVLSGLQVAVRYHPAATEARVGGDWYDAFVTATGAVLLVIGDVSGHDRIAAAAMGQVRNLLRGIAFDSEDGPGVLLHRLDRAVQELDVQALITAVVATVAAATGEGGRDVRWLRWSNAGHPPPMLRLADGTVSVLEGDPDLLLGLDLGTARGEQVAQLPVGSTLLMYTDGLIERRDSTLTLGIAQLAARFAAEGGADPETVCDRLLADGDPDRNEDDIALLLLRVGEAITRPRTATPDAVLVARPDG